MEEDPFVSDTRWCSPRSGHHADSFTLPSTKFGWTHCKPLAGGRTVDRTHSNRRRLNIRLRHGSSADSPWKDVTVLSLSLDSPSPTHRTWSSRSAWCWEQIPENTLSDTTDEHSVEYLCRHYLRSTWMSPRRHRTGLIVVPRRPVSHSSSHSLSNDAFTSCPPTTTSAGEPLASVHRFRCRSSLQHHTAVYSRSHTWGALVIVVVIYFLHRVLLLLVLFPHCQYMTVYCVDVKVQ